MLDFIDFSAVCQCFCSRDRCCCWWWLNQLHLIPAECNTNTLRRFASYYWLVSDRWSRCTQSNPMDISIRRAWPEQDRITEKVMSRFFNCHGILLLLSIQHIEYYPNEKWIFPTCSIHITCNCDDTISCYDMPYTRMWAICKWINKVKNWIQQRLPNQIFEAQQFLSNGEVFNDWWQASTPSKWNILFQFKCACFLLLLRSSLWFTFAAFILGGSSMCIYYVEGVPRTYSAITALIKWASCSEPLHRQLNAISIFRYNNTPFNTHKHTRARRAHHTIEYIHINDPHMRSMLDGFVCKSTFRRFVQH